MASRVFRWAGWALLLAITFATLSPLEHRPTSDAPADVERFLAFAMLGGAFWLGYPKHRASVVLLVIATAGLLELLQDLIPDRHGRVFDALVKSVAGVFGCLAAITAQCLARAG